MAPAWIGIDTMQQTPKKYKLLSFIGLECGGGVERGREFGCVCVCWDWFSSLRETCPETVADFAIATRLFVLNYFCTCTLHFTQEHIHTYPLSLSLSLSRTDNCTYLFAFQFWFSAFAFVHCKAKCYSRNPKRPTPPPRPQHLTPRSGQIARKIKLQLQQ